MSRLSAANAIAVAGVLALGFLGARPSAPRLPSSPAAASARTASPRPVTRSDGTRALLDATGHPVALRPFRRIVSASSVADRLLVELCEPDRVVAFTAYGATHAVQAFQHAGKPRVDGLSDIEAIVALRPDLVVVNHFGDPRRLARLRDAGVEVFDLGEMRGLPVLVPQIETLALLVGHPERGERLARSFERRMRAVAGPLTAAQRPRALYLAIAGAQLYGGTRGTSYHDVIVHAGLRDAAADRYRDWPHYAAEEVLELDPAVVVTKTGMAALICRHAGMAPLRVCRGQGRFVEIPADLVDDPGLALLETVEKVHAAVHGDRPPPPTETP